MDIDVTDKRHMYAYLQKNASQGIDVTFCGPLQDWKSEAFGFVQLWCHPPNRASRSGGVGA